MTLLALILVMAVLPLTILVAILKVSKKTLYALPLAFLALSASAQTNISTNAPPPATNAIPTVQGALDQLFAAVSAGTTNWDVIPYGLYAPGLSHRWGGGLALIYPLSTYIATGPRVDWINGNFWMPSGNITLQVPIRPASWLTVTPFTYAGIGVPLAGAVVGGINLGGNPPRDNNGQATAILGFGGEIDIYKGTGFIKKFGVIGDVERWSGFAGAQYRVGFSLRF